MHELTAVRLVEPDGGLAQHAHDALGHEALLALEHHPELLAVEKLHDEGVGLVVGLLEVAHVDDVIVRQELRHLELALEALDGDVVARHVGVQHLDGDPLLVLHVERFVHAAHPSVGDDTTNLVAHAEKLSDARVLVATRDRNVRRTHERDAVDRTETGVVRVQPTARRATLQLVPPSWAFAGGS